jgi:GTPase
MGFDNGKSLSVDPKANRSKMWQSINDRADRTVTFIDLCGHEAYLKTTIAGLTGLHPDYAMVIIGSNMGVSRMTREHIGIAAALGIPLIIVVTKIDMSPPDVHAKTMETVTKVLKQARKLPLLITSIDQTEAAASTILADRVTPVLCVSAVTGVGMDMIRSLLQQLPQRISGRSLQTGAREPGALFFENKPTNITPVSPSATSNATIPVTPIASTEESKEKVVTPDALPITPSKDGVTTTTSTLTTEVPGECCIDAVFNVPGVGTVVAGTVLRGVIRTGTNMLIGPDRAGEFLPVVVRSIHVSIDFCVSIMVYINISL